jgi:serpin B
MALGMTLNGANGETYTGIQNTLKLAGLTTEEINDSYKNLYNLLLSADTKVDFRIANSIWYRSGIDVKQSFINTNTNYFSAQISGLDFNNPDAADVINAWVNQSTNGKITEIVDKPISRDAFMFLINAIYFKGTWKYEFDKKNTSEQNFYLTDGTNIKCNMMQIESELNCFSTEKLKVVELPYGNGNFSMIILLPDTSVNINDFIDGIDAQKWNDWITNMVKSDVVLSMPKFTFACDYTLNDVLKTMGMETAFSDFADFSGIFENVQASVTKVKHKTYIDVNEEGTEAAAATSVEVGPTAILSNQIIVDRPFVFAIRESNSGCILFMGKVLNPVLE